MPSSTDEIPVKSTLAKKAPLPPPDVSAAHFPPDQGLAQSSAASGSWGLAQAAAAIPANMDIGPGYDMAALVPVPTPQQLQPAPADSPEDVVNLIRPDRYDLLREGCHRQQYYQNEQ